MNSQPIIRADLHVHSIHSERPSEWILKTLGTRESYTQPEHIYRQARERGIDLVTITDHNTIDGVLELRARYGRDILMGVEATTYFPEDGCKIHELIYGFSEGQFAEINRARAKNLKALIVVKADRRASFGVMQDVMKQMKENHLERFLIITDPESEAA
jgi:predicted metal-dependent phosphoesterase TrpH